MSASSTCPSPDLVRLRPAFSPHPLRERFSPARISRVHAFEHSSPMFPSAASRARADAPGLLKRSSARLRPRKPPSSTIIKCSSYVEARTSATQSLARRLTYLRFMATLIQRIPRPIYMYRNPLVLRLPLRRNAGLCSEKVRQPGNHSSRRTIMLTSTHRQITSTYRAARYVHQYPGVPRQSGVKGQVRTGSSTRCTR